MGLLSRDDILNADDSRTKDVPVPEWGGTVRVRSLSGKERDDFEASLQTRRGGKVKENISNFRARLVALCVVNENGERLFAGQGDVMALGNKSVAALQRVFNACNELNGFSDEDIEELAEDFDKEAPEASTSD